MANHLKNWYVNENGDLVFVYSNGMAILLNNQEIQLSFPSGEGFVYSSDTPLKIIKAKAEQAITPQWQKNFMQKFMKGE